PRVRHESQEVRQPRARDDAVLYVVVGRETTHRGESALPAGPEPLAFQRARRDPNLARSVVAADLLDPRSRLVETVTRTVDLDEENAAGVDQIARVHSRLHLLPCAVIHHLDRVAADPDRD